MQQQVCERLAALAPIRIERSGLAIHLDRTVDVFERPCEQAPELVERGRARRASVLGRSFRETP